MLKKILKGLGLVLLGLTLWYFPLIVYGIRQGYGQLQIVWNTQDFDTFLEKSQYPDSLKAIFQEKLDITHRIRRFAIDSLGLHDSKSYTTIYDQQNRPLMWTVSASAPFKLEAKEWNYAFLGNMPYKGYFDSTLAHNLVAELEKEGYDTQIYNPAGWSTLGWFQDPLLSNMLYWSEGNLASLLIHEMTHSTIWVTGSVALNENLADFIGDQGAILYLKHRFGNHSEKIRSYLKRDIDYQKFYLHMLTGAQKLDSLYQTFEEDWPQEKKAKLKKNFIEEIVNRLDTLGLENEARFLKRFREKPPNNAYFMAYRRYREKQNEFEEEYRRDFDSNLRKYIAYLKEKY